MTVIGLGAMGKALAGAFLDNGHPTTVWNRTAGKGRELAGRGATEAATAAEAIAASPVVVVCVLDYDAVREVLGAPVPVPAPAASGLTNPAEPGDVLDGSRTPGTPGTPDGSLTSDGPGAPGAVAGLLAGRTLVNLTNGTPRQARELARWASERGAGYLDGGIMAVPPMIGSPGSLVLCSGSPGAFAAHEGTLSALGTVDYLGEDAGRASLYDIALLSAMYGMFGGFLQAVAITGSERIPATEFTPLVVSWLNAMLTSLPAMAKAYDANDHSATASNLEMQATGFVNLLETGREQGVSTELLEPMGALLARGVAANRGDADLSALIDLLRTDPAQDTDLARDTDPGRGADFAEGSDPARATDAGSRDTGSHGAESHSAESRDTGLHGLGSHGAGSRDTGLHGLGSHDTGSHDLGSHGAESHGLGSHDARSHDARSHDLGSE
ncbi:NAD(P)-binding domain-containing protein [Streptosporangium sp. NPDC002524]|uniref:NAD(P)-dependent oxidoreductase n=1 Tax=Streptosporangium sp. NPDC002524 TaxID=3154537 RepID=UPI0033284CC9